MIPIKFDIILNRARRELQEAGKCGEEEHGAQKPAKQKLQIFIYIYKGRKMHIVIISCFIHIFHHSVVYNICAHNTCICLLERKRRALESAALAPVEGHEEYYLSHYI